MNFSIVQLPIRAFQAAFAIIVLGLTIYVAHWSTNNDLKSPSSNNFLIFASIWSLLTLLYLLVVSRFVAITNHPYAVAGAEAVATIFWFSGFIALAIAIEKYVCFGYVCGVAKAAAVFGGFEFILWAATLIIALIAIFKRNKPAKQTLDSEHGNRF